MNIKDETELKAVIVINQRAYEVPREVEEYIARLECERRHLIEKLTITKPLE